MVFRQLHGSHFSTKNWATSDLVPQDKRTEKSPKQKVDQIREGGAPKTLHTTFLIANTRPSNECSHFCCGQTD